MKKKFAIILALSLCLSLFSGCGGSGTYVKGGTEIGRGVSIIGEPSGRKVRIAIVQQLDQISLDEIRTAVTKELDAKGKEFKLSIELENFNGQGDASILNQICPEIVSDDFDGVITLATLASQCMANAAEEKDLPVIFGAVSNPEDAGLTGLSNVTGTSDRLDATGLIDMIFEVMPKIQTIGLLYSLSEDNSKAPIAEAKAYLDARGVAYIEKTGNTTDELIAAANALCGECDAVFTPTDNRVMAAEPGIAEILTEAGIPHFAGADSFVAEGAFATCGVNYTELGKYTADMAVEVLMTGKFPEYHVFEGNIITVNKTVAEKLGIDYSVYDKLGKKIVEVL